ncbi:hypothetical protein CCP3SC15_200018 [Gammaproteobacteria bacterium]
MYMFPVGWPLTALATPLYQLMDGKTILIVKLTLIPAKRSLQVELVLQTVLQSSNYLYVTVT